MREGKAKLFWLTFEDDFVSVGERLVARRSLDGLPGVGIVILGSQQVNRPGALAASIRTLDFSRPTVLAGQPDAHREAIGTKVPRLDMTHLGIEAYELNARGRGLIGMSGSMSAFDEAFVYHPAANQFDLCAVLFADPTADEPFQIFQIAIRRRRFDSRVADR